MTIIAWNSVQNKRIQLHFMRELSLFPLPHTYHIVDSNGKGATKIWPLDLNQNISTCRLIQGSSVCIQLTKCDVHQFVVKPK